MQECLMSFVKFFSQIMHLITLINLIHLGSIKYLVNSDDYSQNSFSLRFQHAALINTDNRLKASKSVTPGFLIAALLWPNIDVSKEKVSQS